MGSCCCCECTNSSICGRLQVFAAHVGKACGDAPSSRTGCVTKRTAVSLSRKPLFDVSPC